jgi:hypothetical protein
MIDHLFQLLLSSASFNGGPNGFHTEGPLIIVVPTVIAFFGIFFGSLVWVFRDAAKRNKSGFIALLFILLTGWPASFIWWLWLRPPSQSGR